nr:S8 family peptidase [Paraburkholderia acidicola]
MNGLIVKLRAESIPVGNARSFAAVSTVGRMRSVIARVLGGVSPSPVGARMLAAASMAGARVAITDVTALSGGTSRLELASALSGDDASRIAKAFAADRDVEFAEPDQRAFAQSTPTDPLLAQQWNYFDSQAGIELPAAWDITQGSSGVVTAVVDSGYVPHPDLIANVVPGYNFVSNAARSNTNNGLGRGPDATDPGDWVTTDESVENNSPFNGCDAHDSGWHGTRVAGLLGASANNGIGIAGVSPYGKILPVRVLGKCGGSQSDIIDGMRWAAGISVPNVPNNSTPARIINLSLAGPAACGFAMQAAVDDVTSRGVTVVVAAGNKGLSSAPEWPANCRGVIAVGSTDSTGRRAWDSNFGTNVAVSAPGQGVLSTANDGKTIAQRYTYLTDSGTSFAAPQVAGVASLMLARNPLLTPAAIRQILIATARPAQSSFASACNVRPAGAGIVDASAAVKAAGAVSGS